MMASGRRTQTRPKESGVADKIVCLSMPISCCTSWSNLVAIFSRSSRLSPISGASFLSDILSVVPVATTQSTRANFRMDRPCAPSSKDNSTVRMNPERLLHRLYSTSPSFTLAAFPFFGALTTFSISAALIKIPCQ